MSVQDEVKEKVKSVIERDRVEVKQTVNKSTLSSCLRHLAISSPIQPFLKTQQRQYVLCVGF